MYLSTQCLCELVKFSFFHLTDETEKLIWLLRATLKVFDDTSIIVICVKFCNTVRA